MSVTFITSEAKINIPKKVCKCHCGQPFDVDINEKELLDDGWASTDSGFDASCVDGCDYEDYQQLLGIHDKIYRYLLKKYRFTD